MATLGQPKSRGKRVKGASPWDAFTAVFESLTADWRNQATQGQLTLGLFAVRRVEVGGPWEVVGVTGGDGAGGNLEDLEMLASFDSSIVAVGGTLGVVPGRLGLDYAIFGSLVDARGEQFVRWTMAGGGRRAEMEGMSSKRVAAFQRCFRRIPAVLLPRHAKFGGVLARGGESTQTWGGVEFRGFAGDFLGGR